jgi:hypothetical protein
MEAKNFNTRTAFALLCGLAICCSVMYITSDGESVEYVEATKAPKWPIGDGSHTRNPSSIESVDVKKAGTIVTNTPDGRTVLIKYFKKVEDLIAKETESRKKDITAIKAKMVRNMELNAKARNDMKKMLLKKMAKNAKAAKDALDSSMRKVQAQFAKTAEFENKRYKKNEARSAATREVMRKNKHEAAKDLKMAVKSQQRSLAALAATTNAKIHATNKRISANAGQIKANAKAARKALDGAMANFDNKMQNLHAEAKAGRSKLAAQAALQNKKFREFANNKVKAIVASNAAQFAKVRAKMAKDRHHADKMLKEASSRMDAALNAQKALDRKRFAKTIADINAAKKEADARVKAASVGFKLATMKLATTAKKQIGQLNSRVTSLQGVVKQNKLEQAQQNHAVDKELKNMVKIGKARYDEHLKKDKELEALMAKNKAETEGEMNKMVANFKNSMSKIHAQMRKDRAHQASALKSSTNKLYATIAANAAAQGKINDKLVAATSKAKKDAKDALNSAKANWATRLAKMHAIAVASALRHEKKITKLVGIVQKNAIKDAKGRAQLKHVQASTKAVIQHAISNAIHRGEQQALKIEGRAKAMNKATRESLCTRISTEVSDLRRKTGKALYRLSLETKSSRQEMRMVVEAALVDAKQATKKAITKAVTSATGSFSALATLAAQSKPPIAQIAAAKAKAAAQIGNAVDARAKVLLAWGMETQWHKKNDRKKAKHMKLDFLATKMEKIAAAARAALKEDVKDVVNRLDEAAEKAEKGVLAAEPGAVLRYKGALMEVKMALKKAAVAADSKFAKLYDEFAKERRDFDDDLAAATSNLNKKIAEQAALQNIKFSKTVKNTKAAQAQAASQVSLAMKTFSVTLVGMTAAVKKMETWAQGIIEVASGALRSKDAQQVIINARLHAEVTNIVKKSNHRTSSTKRHRKYLSLIDEYKAAAAQEVGQIFKSLNTKLALLRGTMARKRSTAASNLSRATKLLYIAIAKAEAGKGTPGDFKKAKEEFEARLNTMVNAITAKNAFNKRRLADLTGVSSKFSQVPHNQLVLLSRLIKSLNDDMAKAIIKAVQLGEVRGKKEEMANGNTNMLTTASEEVEGLADKLFKGVEGHRKQIADNYLSLKAYATASKDELADFLSRHGRTLSSIGDLLKTIGGLADGGVHTADGVGSGAKVVTLPFSINTIRVKHPMTKVNYLVNEYVGVLTQLQQRWPLGLGKYLLSRVEINMQRRGVLEVDEVSGKTGNYVFINGHSVGLSASLGAFEKLAVRMRAYEQVLRKLTGKVAAVHKKHVGKVYIPPPEWDGN